MIKNITALLYAFGMALCTGAAAQTGTVDVVTLGRQLMTDTRVRLPDNVGNGLNCSNCHIDAGTRDGASSWIGIWRFYPEYRARSGRAISMTERINDCLQRSMNGKPLDENATQMQSMLAYMQSLSNDAILQKKKSVRGFGKIDANLVADPVRGRQVFYAQCASCHGADGLGRRNNTGYLYPPLWGADSFNDGAGMARTYTAAAFVKHNMPYGKGDTLSDQQAVDVAEFFTHQPRPVFAGKAADWPKGDRPKDARN